MRYHVCQFPDKTDNFDFWAHIYPKTDFGVTISKAKSGFGVSTSKKPCEPIFNQNGQLWILRPKFTQLLAIFCFEYCWGCCRELGRGWNELVGGGWSWVELGARFSNTLYFLTFTALLLHKYITVNFYSWKFLSDQMGFFFHFFIITC